MRKVFIVLLSFILSSIVYAQEGVTIDRNLNRSAPSNYKHSIEPLDEVAGNKVFSPLVDNMMNFLGKVDKEEFEIYVGEPVGYEDDNVIVYEIESSYEKVPMALRCQYSETTGKLIHVYFPTPASWNYGLGLVKLTKLYGKDAIVQKPHRNAFGRAYQLDITIKGHFVMQIFDWGISYGYK